MGIKIKLPAKECRPIEIATDAKFVYASPLWLIGNGIRYSHNNHHLSDTKEREICPFCKSPFHIEYNSNGDRICKNCNSRWSTYYGEKVLGEKDYGLIKRVGFKMKHESVLEHSLLVFDITMSRATLQELARHRHISLTVKSTRYTLKELKNEESFYLESDFRCQETEVGKRASKYLIYTGNDRVDHSSIMALENLRQNVIAGISNDISKFSLPDAMITQLQLSVNLRELLHIFKLRLAPDALWEFRIVCYKMFKSLPEEYQRLILEENPILMYLGAIEKSLLYNEENYNENN